MQLSREISAQQNRVLREFVMAWAKAIGLAASLDEGSAAGKNFLKLTDLDKVLGKLQEMFKAEFHHPMPFPLPMSECYIDKKTRMELGLPEQHKVTGAAAILTKEEIAAVIDELKEAEKTDSVLGPAITKELSPNAITFLHGIMPALS